MRRIIIAIGATLSGLVLLFSWPTSTNQPVTDTGSTGGTTTAGGSTTTSGGGTASGVTGTFTGDSASTRYGDVQVQITVTDGVITASDAIAHPSGGRNDQINNYAVPILNDETLAAQSAGIDMISGATFTSRGYAESLQSALDQAGL
jgi:uncharacterized protein with FMN-binding domain